jgi:hypothetical protein
MSDFQRLLEGARTYAIKKKSEELAMTDRDWKILSEKDYLYHFVFPTQSIKTTVRDTKSFIVKANLGFQLGFQSVDMIRLCGHGNSGYLQFGEGLDESSAAEFSELALFIKPDLYAVGVEIHGCGVGSDTSISGA